MRSSFALGSAALALATAVAASGVVTACVHIPANVHDTFEPWQPGEPGNFRPGAKKTAWDGAVDYTDRDAGGDAGEPDASADPEAHGAEPASAEATDAAPPDAGPDAPTGAPADGGVS